jgi:F-type H+-transporting ATPase subunit b
MKRLAILIGLAVLPVMSPAARAQQPKPDAAERAAEPPEKSDEGRLAIWKWANFAILAGFLGYMAAKKGGPYFAGRSRQIRKDMIEAGDLRQQAEARAAEVDRRLASLDTEIAALRAEAAREAEAEGERLSRHTTAEIAKIHSNAGQEIESAGKAARMELRRYTVGLAIRLAEQKIRTRLTPEMQEALVHGFIHHLEPPARSQTN